LLVRVSWKVAGFSTVWMSVQAAASLVVAL
jgi:hypothetical protein